jgi:hypothetical protein
MTKNIDRSLYENQMQRDGFISYAFAKEYDLALLTAMPTRSFKECESPLRWWLGYRMLLPETTP